MRWATVAVAKFHLRSDATNLRRRELRLARHNGVAVTADLVAYRNVVYSDQVLSDTSSMRFVPEAIRRNWNEWSGSQTAREFREILRPILPLELENVRVLHEAAVVLLAGTDVGVPLQIFGLRLHKELLRLVEAGWTPLQTLQAATINPARGLGMSESLGTIEQGKLADLVLLDANPLEDISNTQRIRAVVADGRAPASSAFMNEIRHPGFEGTATADVVQTILEKELPMITLYGGQG